MSGLLHAIFVIIANVIGWGMFVAYLGWALYASYRAIFKAGKNGTLPWL
ncbi:MAG: hypothetical protein HUK14_04765 [Muribaculaceae bacterium]|nr:hypothetical protein [Muribaculaceae bacterium]